MAITALSDLPNCLTMSFTSVSFFAVSCMDFNVPAQASVSAATLSESVMEPDSEIART